MSTYTTISQDITCDKTSKPDGSTCTITSSTKDSPSSSPPVEVGPILYADQGNHAYLVESSSLNVEGRRSQLLLTANDDASTSEGDWQHFLLAVVFGYTTDMKIESFGPGYAIRMHDETVPSVTRSPTPYCMPDHQALDLTELLLLQSTGDPLLKRLAISFSKGTVPMHVVKLPARIMCPIDGDRTGTPVLLQKLIDAPGLDGQYSLLALTQE